MATLAQNIGAINRRAMQACNRPIGKAEMDSTSRFFAATKRLQQLYPNSAERMEIYNQIEKDWHAANPGKENDFVPQSYRIQRLDEFIIKAEIEADPVREFIAAKLDEQDLEDEIDVTPLGGW